MEENIFGSNLKKARKAAFINQMDLAKKCGISFNTICNWETGKTFPKDKNKISRIASALNVTVEELLGSTEYIKEDKKSTNIVRVYKYRKPVRKVNSMSLISDASILFAGNKITKEEAEQVQSVINMLCEQYKNK